MALVVENHCAEMLDRGLVKRLSVLRYLYLIIHRNSVGRTGVEVCEWFARNPEYTGGFAGYHLFIRKDGTVDQLIPLSLAAQGASAANRLAVQVALDGDFTEHPPTPAQAVAVIELCTELLCWRPTLGIFGHTENPDWTRHKGHICPGKHLSLDGLRTAVSTAHRAGIIGGLSLTE